MGAGPPRLMIAAPHGRSGKTTVTVGLCAALAARGVAVQPFKKGPDYIDPSWLTEAAGRACRALDYFFMPADGDLARAFQRGAAGADISIIEGNHGLYDSAEDDGNGSAAALARLLGAPILLVIDAARMGRSAAALVLGMQRFEPDTPIVGVILNRVAGARHEAKLRQAIETYCGLRVAGALPHDPALTIPDRHLGLVPRGEDEGLLPAIAAYRRAAEAYLDLDLIIELGRGANALSRSAGLTPNPSPAARDFPNTGRGENALTPNPSTGGRGENLLSPPLLHSSTPSPTIGVFRDRAFSFYYPENLEALAEQGAELVFIDALRDTCLPRVQALYIGGGFPEIFMEELSANAGLRESVRREAEAGLPLYAECGGLMYLAQRITWRERSAEMAGVLPCEVELLSRPQGHGYVLAEAANQNPFLPAGTTVRGHEFHHSHVLGASSLPRAYRLARGSGLGDGTDGLVYRNVLASYTHLHAAGCPEWAAGFAARARAG